ncbi:Crp/Fnr family transcriptional regulator [Vibrio ostreicida]|uniref:Crp/Fnr family transcriptional regulator n=1 Tax=Vibrio ostreicida TaxID=526588 RepID=UPI003B59D721
MDKTLQSSDPDLNAAYSFFQRLGVEDADHYFNTASIAWLEKSAVLQHQGKAQHYAYYLMSGILKACHYSESGVERCKEFYFPNSLCLIFPSWIQNQDSRYQLESVTQVKCIKLPISLLSSQQWITAKVQLLEQQLLYKEQKEAFFLLSSHEERYEYLVINFPHWIQHLKSLDIANYMGISPVSLSRIKKRINKC